jgi:hypothetical protein
MPASRQLSVRQQREGLVQVRRVAEYRKRQCVRIRARRRTGGSHCERRGHHAERENLLHLPSSMNPSPYRGAKLRRSVARTAVLLEHCC